jgi:thiol-disulfide isomerase/thioredoxin
MRNSTTRRPGQLLEAMLAVFLIAGSLAFNKTSARPVQNLGSITRSEASDLQGRLWTCQEMKGKVVLIEFWATWYPHCLAEIENRKKAYQRYHDQGFEIIGVCLDLADRREKQLGRAGIGRSLYSR